MNIFFDPSNEKIKTTDEGEKALLEALKQNREAAERFAKTALLQTAIQADLRCAANSLSTAAKRGE